MVYDDEGVLKDSCMYKELGPHSDVGLEPTAFAIDERMLDHAVKMLLQGADNNGRARGTALTATAAGEILNARGGHGLGRPGRRLPYFEKPTVTVIQTSSPIGRPEKQRATLRGLGLNKMHRRSTLEDTPAVRGMIQKVAHLVTVVNEPNNLAFEDLSNNLEFEDLYRRLSSTDSEGASPSLFTYTALALRDAVGMIEKKQQDARTAGLAVRVGARLYDLMFSPDSKTAEAAARCLAYTSRLSRLANENLTRQGLEVALQGGNDEAVREALVAIMAANGDTAYSDLSVLREDATEPGKTRFILAYALTRSLPCKIGGIAPMLSQPDLTGVDLFANCRLVTTHPGVSAAGLTKAENCPDDPGEFFRATFWAEFDENEVGRDKEVFLRIMVAPVSIQDFYLSAEQLSAELKDRRR